MISTQDMQISWSVKETLLGDSNENATPTRLLHVLLAPESEVEVDLLGPNARLLRREEIPCKEEVSSAALHYLVDHITASPASRQSILLTFVLPYTTGFVVRSDFLQVRLGAFAGAGELKQFLEPLQYCVDTKSVEDGSFRHTVDCAVGVLSTPVYEGFDFESLEDGITGRISYPWLSTEPISPRRVALFRGRPNHKTGYPVYSAAYHLGISLVIIDEPGHWLQPETPDNQALREAFIPIDISEDDDLPSRIGTAVQQFPQRIDGIFTLSDNYLVAVSRAAELLALPTCPSSAYEVAYDKHQTRRLQSAPHEFASVKSPAELLAVLGAGSFTPIYPLIVKPRTRGWSSEFVTKVTSQADLETIVTKICTVYAGGALIEPYYDGPELDVNIIVSNGRVLYSEIVDELPSNGDTVDAPDADFLESGMIVPSKLPALEQGEIVRQISEVVVGLGFTDGVFHTEVRLTQSSMCFAADEDAGGCVDLVPQVSTAERVENNKKGGNKPGSVRAHIVEINARPPGIFSQKLAAHTFGVDYFAARMIAATARPNTRDLLPLVSIPFTLPFLPTGAQSHAYMLFLPVLAAGKSRGTVVLEELLDSVKGARECVVETHVFFQEGEMMEDPRLRVGCFARCILSSVRRRGEVVQIADKLRRRYLGEGSEDKEKIAWRHTGTDAGDINAEERKKKAEEHGVTGQAKVEGRKDSAWEK